MTRIIFWRLEAGLFLSGAALCAFPQDATAQSNKAAATNVGEIVITARRRGEPLGRAGAPVSVLSGEDIIETGINETDRIDGRFPALTVQPTASGNLVFVRGVGNFTLTANSDPAVAYSYDGVFVSRPTGTMSQFFDLDRMELLKGPQGVLYGRNASAGSINIEPRQPVIGDTSAHAHFGAGSLAEVKAEGAINVGVGERTAFRLSGARAGRDHYLAGYRGGPVQHSARAQLRSLVAEGLAVRLSADYNHIGGPGVGSSYVGKYVYVPSEARYDFMPSGLPFADGLYTANSQAFVQTITAGSSGRNLDPLLSTPFQDHRFYGAHARIDANLGIGDLVLIPAWRKADFDGIMASSPFGYHQREKDVQTSVEARLSGRIGIAEWLAGAFLFDETIETDNVTNLSSSLFLAKQSYELKSRAIFGNVIAHVLPRLRLSGGLRWTRDLKRYESDTETLAIICQRRVDNRASCPSVPLFPLTRNLAEISFPVPAQPGERVPIVVNGASTGAVATYNARSDRGRLTDGAVTWRAGAEADLDKATLLYATVETGYRAGGFNSALGFETFDPERITAYTLGLRHRRWGGRLQLDVETFSWNYRDQHVSSLRPDLSTPPRNANITDNIGNSRIRGIELDARLEPWRGGQLGAILQLLDADYSSFEYLQANTGVRPLTGCEAKLSATTNLYTIDCSDKQPYNSPRWSMAISARHGFRVGGFTLTAAADMHFRSARNIGFAFLPEQRIGASWTSNAQLILGKPHEKIQIAAFVRNVEGTRIPQFMIYHPVSNALVAVTSPPRQWGIRASLGL